MKITLRLIFSIVLAITILASLWSYLYVKDEKKRLTIELEHRTSLISDSLQDTASSYLAKNSTKSLDRLLNKITSAKEILGIAVYDLSGNLIATSKSFAAKTSQEPSIIFEEFTNEHGHGIFDDYDNQQVYLFATPLSTENKERLGTLVIFNDASYINTFLAKIWQRNFARLLLNALVISIITIVVVRLSILAPIKKTVKWIKDIHKNTKQISPPPQKDLFAPLSEEISNLGETLTKVRSSAEEEARLREKNESLWTPVRLKEYVKTNFEDKRIIMVSNREPYIHINEGSNTKCVSPASGMITAIEPILKACDGLWIAHGAGDADKENVDKHNKVRVPPENPQYELKRVWLTKEEEEGYYYGFSNEGLWPLCHIAYTRPTFRNKDWLAYQNVNSKFAGSINEEIDDNSIIFIQDYHFSILPKILKKKHPGCKIALFWHIPWPNQEIFRICPQKKEILCGLLGADLLGFHTQFHCNNFLDTVERVLECRVNWEEFSVEKMGHKTLVKPFPISIDPTPHVSLQDTLTKEIILKNLGLSAAKLGVGVDRIDYTKGILERFRAIERLLDKYPKYVGKFTFIQIGAPSREHIQKYRDLANEIHSEVHRINWKFKTKNWQPIVFLAKHFSHKQIAHYYQAADLCMVTSLHDGMNLVAKEFIASKENQKGSLILSTFTGAAGELTDALFINPYDIEHTADTIKIALEMNPDEQASRIQRMQDTIKNNNVYKWAADILSELDKLQKY